jgi:hypothetical protein
MPFKCSLCSLIVEEIPDDAVLIGRLHRFDDGSFHLLRKQMPPRTGPRPRKRNPDQQAPPETPPPVMGHGAANVPEYVEPIVVEPEEEVPVGESAMQKAFRLLAKVNA